MRLTIPLRQAVLGGERQIDLSRHGHGEPIKLRIPPGVEHGQKLRVTGKGAPSPAGGPPGDLLLEIEVLADPVFTRDGHDLTITVAVPFSGACLGTSVEVPTMDGDKRVKVKAGTKSGSRLRLKGYGVPGHPAGDLYARHRGGGSGGTDGGAGTVAGEAARMRAIGTQLRSCSEVPRRLEDRGQAGVGAAQSMAFREQHPFEQANGGLRVQAVSSASKLSLVSRIGSGIFEGPCRRGARLMIEHAAGTDHRAAGENSHHHLLPREFRIDLQLDFPGNDEGQVGIDIAGPPKIGPRGDHPAVEIGADLFQLILGEEAEAAQFPFHLLAKRLGTILPAARPAHRQHRHDYPFRFSTGAARRLSIFSSIRANSPAYPSLRTISP